MENKTKYENDVYHNFAKVHADTMLYWALAYRDESLIDHLVAHYEKELQSSSYQIVKEAAETEHYDIAEKFIPFLVKEEDHYYLLDYFAFSFEGCDPDKVSWLATHGIDINAYAPNTKKYENRTRRILDEAIRNCDLKMTKLFVELGAEVDDAVLERAKKNAEMYASVAAGDELKKICDYLCEYASKGKQLCYEEEEAER